MDIKLKKKNLRNLKRETWGGKPKWMTGDKISQPEEK